VADRGFGACFCSPLRSALFTPPLRVRMLIGRPTLLSCTLGRLGRASNTRATLHARLTPRDAVLAAKGVADADDAGDSYALGHIACRHRYQMLFIRADEMPSKLRQCRLDKFARRVDDRAVHGRPPDHRRLRTRTHDARGEQRRLPAVRRAHRASGDHRDQQRKHERVARDIRRRAARTERR
jgi:hypothetical protein